MTCNSLVSVDFTLVMGVLFEVTLLYLGTSIHVSSHSEQFNVLDRGIQIVPVDGVCDGSPECMHVGLHVAVTEFAQLLQLGGHTLEQCFIVLPQFDRLALLSHLHEGVFTESVLLPVGDQPLEAEVREHHQLLLLE